MRQREPCCWKCTSSVAQRSTAASSISPWSFFYAPSAVQDRLAQSRDEACVAEIPTAETDAGIAVPPSRSRTPCHSPKLRPTSFAAVTHCYADDFGGGPGNFSPSVQVPSDSNPMEMLGLPSQEGGGIGDELTASEEALRFGWASWAVHGLFKKLTDCGDAS